MERTKTNFEPAETLAVSTDLSSILSCRCCGSPWADPTTLKCGHTFCRACIERGLAECESGECVVCGCAVERTYLARCRMNILLSQILRKCFPDEMVVNELKVAGNRLAARSQFDGAIEAYTEAIKMAPNDLHLRNCRSWAYSAVGLHQNALEDADIIIQLQPRRTQGYCRRAVALRGLLHLEESVQCYLQCLAINPRLSLAKTELAKVLHELLSRSSLTPDGKAPARFSLIAPPNGRSVHCAARASGASGCGPTEVSCVGRGQHERSLGVAGAKDVPHLRRKCVLSYLLSAKKTIPKTPPSSSSSFFCCPGSLPYRTLPRSVGRFPPDSVSVRTQLERLSAEDLECSLCSSLLLSPMTTDCGHVFCRDCLYRSLDYRVACPLCQESLAEFLAERRHATTESVEMITKFCFSKELKKREKQRKQDLSLWSRNVGDQLDLPIFVCTLAYPSIPCPLHIFEPRYRLMIRRCMESGVNQFGMCICLDQSEENFAEYGTLLLIRNVNYLSDGRSVLDTIGVRRFRVVSRGLLDGHHTARVAYLSDETIPSNEVEDLRHLQMDVHAMSSRWFSCLPKPAQSRILQCYGQLPQPEFPHQPDGPSWVWYMTVILPIGPQSQLKILSMLSPRKRLLTIRRVMTCLLSIS